MTCPDTRIETLNNAHRTDRRFSRALALGALVGLSALALSACGNTEDPAEEGGITTEDYREAIPDMAMLSVNMDEGAIAQALESGQVSQSIVGEPSDLRGHAQAVMQDLDTFLNDVHAQVDAITENVEPIVGSENGMTCRVWQFEADTIEWQLASCAKDRIARRFWYVLRGRHAGSTSEADFLPIFAGEGVALPRFDGKRRGHGAIGFSFDNVAALTGENVSGALGVGYRAAGRVRQLVLGMDNVQGEQDDQSASAIYHYTHILGRGGRFAFDVYGDFLTSEGGEVESGQDGIKEFARAAVVWKRDTAARAVMGVCGGSLGEHCFRVAQCWMADGDVTYEDVSNDVDSEIRWSPAECPVVPMALDAPPEESDMSFGDADDETTGAPALDAPVEHPEE